MKVLLVASDKAELKPFGDECIKIVSGVGPILAAAAAAYAIAEYKPDVVFSVGSAGSMGKLKIGDVASFAKVITPDSDLSAFHLSPGSTLLPSRASLSAIALDGSSSLVLSSSGRFASERSSLSDAADMEAYGVALSAYLRKIPCYAVKLITDIVGEKITLGDYGYNLRTMREAMAAKVDGILRGL